jgi:F-type H+-transporting ATPase subunit gamma
MPASMKQIKARIQATKKTSQITKAMNMVSASKMKRAERSIKTFIPFTERVRSIVSHVVMSDIDIKHPLLLRREIKKRLYIVITSDRGLAGPYNSNILKEMKKIVKNDPDASLITIGKKAASYSKTYQFPVINTQNYAHPDEVLFGMVKAVIAHASALYAAEEIDAVYLVYNHYINTLVQETRTQQLLPIEAEESDSLALYEFEGGPQAIIDTVLPVYIENMLYGAMLDSKASEHASRMTAMQAATDNALDLIRQLNLYYNRARQTSVTLELTDIIGGANAVGGES